VLEQRLDDSVEIVGFALSSLAAILRGIPAREAISTARSTRFSGENRPRKARYFPAFSRRA
jgi:hypothetical protein